MSQKYVSGQKKDQESEPHKSRTEKQGVPKALFLDSFSQGINYAICKLLC